MSPERYVAEALERGDLRAEHVVELVRHFQRARGLAPDGKAGPLTRAAIEREISASRPAGELRVVDGWLHGPGVTRLCAESSWFGGRMLRGPQAIVAHYTATDPGTALSMAERRLLPRGGADRAASWHVTIAQDGAVYQMVPLASQAWHVASKAPVGRGLPRANECAIGIELEGHGDRFPALQVDAACRVWRALVTAYPIPRELAMVQHAALQSNRSDPGPAWMRDHAGWVLDAAYR